MNTTATFTIGKDLTVNRMGYGAMRITGPGIWGPPTDRAEAIRVLQKTRELGINFIDTADSYGPNVADELIAEALYPYSPDLVIATKGGFMRTGPNQWVINGRPDYLKGSLEGSLKRLRLERIDLYQLHRIDPKVPADETIGFLKEAQQQGLIRHIGLSEVSVDDIKKAQEQVEVVSVQNKYSYNYRKWEEVLKYCEEQNMAFIPWNPINAGNQESADTIKRIAAKYGASEYGVMLSWLLHHSPNMLLIPGTSKVAHLIENARAADIALTDEEINEIGN